MKKFWIASPTILLLLVVLGGAFASGSLHANLLGFGGIGLALYAFAALFVYGLAYAFGGHSHEKMPLSTRLLFYWLLLMLIGTVGTAIFFMAHN